MKDPNPIRQEFEIAGVHGYRYAGDGPYSVLICHGLGGHDGMYDKWAIHHRETFGTDVGSWDMPGFGRTGVRGHLDAAAMIEALQMHSDPDRLVVMKLSGLATLPEFDPPKPLAENTKPFLMLVAEFDRLFGGIEQVKSNFAVVGGPTTLVVKDGSDKHQLMLIETAWFSQQIDAWCMVNLTT